MFHRLHKLITILRHRTFRKALLRHGVAASVEHLPVLSNRSYSLVIDVGANRGQFSLVIRTLSPHARIHAFEPLADEAARYDAAFRGDAQVTLHRFALGSLEGVQDLHLSARADSSSLLTISPLQAQAFRGTQEVSTMAVTVRRLDDVLFDIPRGSETLLKLDVQGYELSVLDGATRVLEAKPDIFLEVSFVELYTGQPLADEVITTLASRGYRIVAMGRPTMREGTVIQADLLFSGK